MTQGDRAPVFVELLARLATELDHPAEKVWHYLLNWNLFVGDKEFSPRRVAGQPGVEGEVKGVSHLDSTGRVDSLFFLKTIKIVPNRQIVVKVLSPEYVYDASTGRSTEVHQTGYEVFNILERNGKVLLTLDICVETAPPGITPEEGRRLAEQYTRDTEANWYQKYFPKLKELLAQG